MGKEGSWSRGGGALNQVALPGPLVTLLEPCMRPGSDQQHVSCCIIGNGNWGEWEAYGSCSVTCGVGVSVSRRQCDNPRKNRWGDPCPGSRRRTQTCEGSPCLSKINVITFLKLLCTVYCILFKIFLSKFDHWLLYLYWFIVCLRYGFNFFMIL